MKNVVIYSSNACPYCIKAKKLLEAKGVNYKELRIDENSDFIDEAVKRSGGRTTVPQIFIDDFHVGGCDELYALDRENKLDPLLEG
jgi:glutaredoxin 3